MKKCFWASSDFRKLTHLILWMSEKRNKYLSGFRRDTSIENYIVATSKGKTMNTKIFWIRSFYFI